MPEKMIAPKPISQEQFHFVNFIWKQAYKFLCEEESAEDMNKIAFERVCETIYDTIKPFDTNVNDEEHEWTLDSVYDLVSWCGSFEDYCDTFNYVEIEDGVI
jgi:hypothetical protein